MRYKIFTLFCLAVTSLFTLLYAGTIREQFDETFKLDKGGKLILSNTNGSITVASWDKNQVKVEAEKIVKAGDRRQAEKIMEEIRIEINHDDDFLEIKTHIPKYRSGLWDSIFGDHVSVSVKYRLLVPNQLNLDVSTVNGGVEVSEVAGQIRVKSTNGRIQIYKAEGSVNASTTNGGIDAELLDFDENEDMSFKTTNGGIKVYFPKNFRAYVDARTTNGSIKTDFPIEVRGEISRRRLRGAINGGGGRIDLHTTNGSIKILQQ